MGRGGRWEKGREAGESSKPSASLSIENVKYYAPPLLRGRINIVRGSLLRAPTKAQNDFRAHRCDRDASHMLYRPAVGRLCRANFSLFEFLRYCAAAAVQSHRESVFIYMTRPHASAVVTRSPFFPSRASYRTFRFANVKGNVPGNRGLLSQEARARRCDATATMENKVGAGSQRRSFERNEREVWDDGREKRAR